MRLRVALIAAVAALGAVVLLVRSRGSDASADAGPPSTTSGSETATEANRTAAPTRNRGPRVAGEPEARPERVRVTGLPEELHASWLAVEHAAKDCYRGRPVPPPTRPNGPDETIETLMLEYRVVVQGGVGKLEDLRVTDGALTDAELQGCIVEAVAAATWEDVAADGVLAMMKHEINLGDLMRPDHGLLPESERPPIEPLPPGGAPPLGVEPAEPSVDEHPSVYDSSDPPSK